MIVTVSEKGQVVIPAELRRLLGITAGTKLNLVPDAGGFVALLDDPGKTLRAADCIGVAGYVGEAIPAEQLDVARYTV